MGVSAGADQGPIILLVSGSIPDTSTPCLSIIKHLKYGAVVDYNFGLGPNDGVRFPTALYQYLIDL